MRYLETAIMCSQDPIISLKSQKYLNFIVVIAFCGWNITSCLYPFITQPNYDQSQSDWITWFLSIYWNFTLANQSVFLCFIIVTTIITVFAISKQFQYISNLKREYAFDLNKAAFIFHAALMFA